MNYKRTCKECGWHGQSDELLTADHPFTADILVFCPQCKQVDSCLVACDTDGCWDSVTCGTPAPKGYRQTCSKHRPPDAMAAKAAGGES